MIYVFTGPTLSPEQAGVELDATYLPPVSQGDVYRVARERPRAIGIIDGYFERVPAVWHKEILWALKERIPVFGSASMGALRAAELAEFGMVGAGRIFEAYRTGAIEDDDEVALLHGPAESGYLALSEALVNIRATLEAAVADGIVGESVAAGVVAAAKALHYKNRNYPAILAAARENALPATELDALRCWLPQRRVNQKRSDALLMLRLMREQLGGSHPPPTPDYHFEHTVFWDDVTRTAGDHRIEPGDEAAMLTDEEVWDELRLDGHAYSRARLAALLRHLALQEAARCNYEVDRETVGRVAEKFRQRAGLQADPAFGDWLQSQGLSMSEFLALMEEEARLGWIQDRLRPAAERQMVHHLIVSGRYGSLRERARDKSRVLAERSLDSPGEGEAGASTGDVVEWYFQRSGRPRPTDLSRYAQASGFGEKGVFLRAVMREYCYQRLRADDGTSAPASSPSSGPPSPGESR